MKCRWHTWKKCVADEEVVKTAEVYKSFTDVIMAHKTMASHHVLQQTVARAHLGFQIILHCHNVTFRTHLLNS